MSNRFELHTYDSIKMLFMTPELRELLLTCGIDTIEDLMGLTTQKFEIHELRKHLVEIESLVESLENDTNPAFRLISWEEEMNFLASLDEDLDDDWIDSEIDDFLSDEDEGLETKSPFDPVSEFHMWIDKSNYFYKALLYNEKSEYTYFGAYSKSNRVPGLTLFTRGHLIGWYSGDQCYPVIVEYSEHGNIAFRHVDNFEVLFNITNYRLTECVNTYVIHNDSFHPVKVRGFDEIPPGGCLKFNEADFCGERFEGATIVGHGVVISAPKDTRFFEFLEKPGTIEKITDKMWNFYTDKGYGSFEDKPFFLEDVTESSISGKLLTLKINYRGAEKIIRILLD